MALPSMPHISKFLDFSAALQDPYLGLAADAILLAVGWERLARYVYNRHNDP